jgi:hypothetical protein
MLSGLSNTSRLDEKKNSVFVFSPPSRKGLAIRSKEATDRELPVLTLVCALYVLFFHLFLSVSSCSSMTVAIKRIFPSVATGTVPRTNVA